MTNEREEYIWDMDNVRRYSVCGKDFCFHFDDETDKAIVVGEKGVGKSSLISQFFEEAFTPAYNHTIESKEARKQVKLMDKYLSCGL